MNDNCVPLSLCQSPDEVLESSLSGVLVSVPSQPITSFSSVLVPVKDICVLCGAEIVDPGRAAGYFHKLYNMYEMFKRKIERRKGEQVGDISLDSFMTGYFHQFFVDMGCVGRGSFGSVHLCGHVLDNELIGFYACKLVPVGDSKPWLMKTLREVRIREKFHHRNIVNYNHSWLEMHQANELAPEIPWLFILMEHCNAGDLESLINDAKEKRVKLELDQIWCIFTHILRGLDELHSAFVLHRDLKPSNVLLHVADDRSRGLYCTVKLADFGTAAFLNNKVERVGFTGTIEYTAPELLQTDEQGFFPTEYDTSSDMYSLGVILFEMLLGEVPYSSVFTHADKARHEILEKTKVPLDITIEDPTLRAIVQSLLSLSPQNRPSTRDLLLEPALQKFFNISNSEVSLAALVQHRVPQFFSRAGREVAKELVRARSVDKDLNIM